MNWLEKINDKAWFHIFKSYTLPETIYLEDIILKGNSITIRCYFFLSDQEIHERWEKEGVNAVYFTIGALSMLEPPRIGTKNITSKCEIQITGEKPKMNMVITKENGEIIIETTTILISINNIERCYIYP
ncbi:hypothetical protein [Photobacterium toruni]|uniref:Uncharacterized protein n=1 Tax=Photobacterium toruni TaxID=1935446 RepID=A0A1T4UTM3_9GAMM|nr:hypothetical protein [Photobacterium toruni]SKA55781.1 hypothetical protein CZ814_03663 [Photobacterium toruni]